MLFTRAVIALLTSIVILDSINKSLHILLVMQLNIFAIPFWILGIVNLPLSAWYIVVIIWIGTYTVIKEEENKY